MICNKIDFVQILYYYKSRNLFARSTIIPAYIIHLDKNQNTIKEIKNGGNKKG